MATVWPGLRVKADPVAAPALSPKPKSTSVEADVAANGGGVAGLVFVQLRLFVDQLQDALGAGKPNCTSEKVKMEMKVGKRSMPISPM